MSVSKVGLHTIQPGGQEINWISQMAQSGSPFVMVKGVDCPQLSVGVKRVSPETQTVVRFTGYDDVQAISDSEMPNYAAIAQRAFQPYDRLTAEEQAKADWFEPINEPSPPDVAGYERLSLLMKHLMEEANRRGVKILLYSLNAGTPEWEQMLAMANSGVFDMAKAWRHGLALHEGVFGRDDVERGFGDAIPGAPYVPGAGSLCFRYRYLYHLLKERGVVIPLVLSEFRVNGGGIGLQTSELIRRFLWYDLGIRKDKFVLATLPFTVAPSSGWENHDYSPIYPDLMAALRAELPRTFLTNQSIFNMVAKYGWTATQNFIGRIPYDLLHAMAIDRQGTYLGPSPLNWLPERDILEFMDAEMRQKGWEA